MIRPDSPTRIPDMKPSFRHLILNGLCLLLAACGQPNERLDEYIFHEEPGLSLKVVRYFRNIPFNYLGEYGVVMCRSANTRDFAAGEQQDNGWRKLGEGPTKDSKTAAEVADIMKPGYRVIDGHILVATRQVFNISFDACGHFSNWDPTRLPRAMINAAENPETCTSRGSVDCRYFDYEGDRMPQYNDIQASGTGQASFRVTTPTFKDVQSLQVQTTNNGNLWHVQTVGLAGGGQTLSADSLRALPASVLGANNTVLDLSAWFESVLPAGSMIIWPDALVGCNEQMRADDSPGNNTCARIRFSDAAGNASWLAIDMGSNGSQPAFHSGEFSDGNQSRAIASLEDLREHPGIVDSR